MFHVVDTTLFLYITLNTMLVMGHSSSTKYFGSLVCQMHILLSLKKQ